MMLCSLVEIDCFSSELFESVDVAYSSLHVVNNRVGFKVLTALAMKNMSTGKWYHVIW
jgi:hypothetical protein